jgi:hypothetical protein
MRRAHLDGQGPEGARLLEPKISARRERRVLLARIEQVEPDTPTAEIRELEDDLVRRFRLSGGADEEWGYIEAYVMRYAHNTVAARLKDGTIFKFMAELGVRPGPDLALPSAFTLTAEDRRDIASLTVSVALNQFRPQLLAGRWDNSRPGAAGLRTFFVNKCFLVFRTPWNNWLSRQIKTRKLAVAMSRRATDEAFVPHDRPADHTIAALDVERAIGRLDPALQHIVRLTSEGLSKRQIATALGIGIKAVEYRLIKARREMGNLEETYLPGRLEAS